MFWMNIWINLLFLSFVGSLLEWNERTNKAKWTSIEKPTRKTKKKKKKGRWLLLPQSKKRLSNIPLFGHVSLFMFSYCDGRAMVRQPTPKASGISFTFSLHHKIEFFFFSILNLALIVFWNLSEISNSNGDRKCFIIVVVVVVVGMMRLLEVNRRIEVAVSYFLIFIFSTLFEW